jgi:oxygen-independent coproporphyrinogen-3 oxidase
MGFDNINVDLMFSLPGQTMDDWAETLREAASLKPAHISAYSLIVEEGPEFSRLYGEGKLDLLGEEEDREMYHAVSDILGAYGYRQYEISNYALEGRECRHNVKYWAREPYIGLGLGSHSFYDGMRWHNTYDLDKYLRMAEGMGYSGLREEINKVPRQEAMEETMFLGLRLNKGVDADGFYRAFHVGLFEVYGDAIDRMVGLGLMGMADGRVFLTDKGRDVSNYVFLEFML